MEVGEGEAQMEKPVVLITGALTGIGRATALAFAKDGARVVVSGRREAEGKALEGELRGLGAEAAFIPADVRLDADVSNLVDKTVARFGGLDVAVNNAGTDGSPRPLRGARERDRLHRVGPGFIHPRPRPQRRRRQDEVTRGRRMSHVI